MPAKTKKQRQMMAIAEHHPGKLYKRNKDVLKMSKSQLSEFASTKGLTKQQKKSTKGSPTMSNAEMTKGYRHLGKGLPVMDGKAHSDNRGEGY